MKPHTLSILVVLTLVVLTPLSTARPFTIPSIERMSDEPPKLCKRARKLGGLPSQKCLCSLIFKRKVRTEKTSQSKKLCLKFFGKKRTILALQDPCEEFMAYPKVIDLTRLSKKMNRYFKKCKPTARKVVFAQCMIFRALFKRNCLLVLSK